MNTQHNTTEVNTILDTAFENHPIRVFGDAENPLFVATDVCEVLNLDWPSARRRLPEWGKGGCVRGTTLGGTQEMATLTEGGLYYLTMRSDKPAALRFAEWVCREVLPAIRRDGYYTITGLSDELRRLKAAQLEVRAIEYEVAAKRTRLERLAVLRNEIPGGVPVGALVHDMHPSWSQQKQASLCSRIVARAEAAEYPVGHTRCSHGRVRTMLPKHFQLITQSLHLSISDIRLYISEMKAITANQ